MTFSSSNEKKQKKTKCYLNWLQFYFSKSLSKLTLACMINHSIKTPKISFCK